MYYKGPVAIKRRDPTHDDHIYIETRTIPLLDELEYSYEVVEVPINFMGNVAVRIYDKLYELWVMWRGTRPSATFITADNIGMGGLTFHEFIEKANERP